MIKAIIFDYGGFYQLKQVFDLLAKHTPLNLERTLKILIDCLLIYGLKPESIKSVPNHFGKNLLIFYKLTQNLYVKI